MYFTKVIIERALPWLAILLFATQVILPLLFPSLEFFWLFRKKKKDEDTLPQLPQMPLQEKRSLDESVDEIANELDADTQKLKGTKTKVDETINKLSDAKKQSDNNLNDSQQ